MEMGNVPKRQQPDQRANNSRSIDEIVLFVKIN